MANANAPFGMRPVRYYSSGKPYTGGFTQYFATGASGIIAPGDPVKLAGAANTTVFQGMEPGWLGTVALADDGDADPLAGVCVGVQFVTGASLPYREDSTDRIINVADDADLVFWVQTNAASTAWAGTDVHSYANMKIGTAALGSSTWTADTTDVPDTTDVSNQLLILGLAKIPGNAIGAYSIWEVLINNHAFGNAADLGRASGI